MDYKKKPGQKIDLIGKVLNTEKPTISIITPFYNGGKTLMETANSVFNQTYPFFEWIIVDDGSKDEESLSELAKLEKMDQRIKVFHKENGGPSVARDYGIEKSGDTKYVFFLDCDDILDKTILECLYWTLETHKDCSFAYTTMVNFGDREFLWEQYLTTDREKYENVICISSMIRKKDLLEVGCFGIKEKAMYEDWNLWLKLLAKGKKPIRVNAPLFWYRINNTGEFSRAKENHKRAMKYINETAKTIKDDVEIVQFPREGDKYCTVENYDMILPNYEKSKKKKILFLFPWMVVGGADYFNRDLLARLDKDKYESIVLTSIPNNNVIRQDFEEHAKEVYDMASFLERKDYLNFTDYIISSRKVDAIFISNTLYGYYMAPYLKRKYPNIPILDYIHSIDNADAREGFGRATRDVDRFLTHTYCCNNFTKNQLINKFNKNNVDTIYIGTDDKKFDPSKYDKKALKEKNNIPTDKYIVSFIARLSDEKRPLMFVSIAKELLKRRNDVFFIIGGDGPLMKKVSSKVDSNFKLLGMVKENEEFYAMSDITVNCSSLEGLALTSYESLSMNVPIVSTDVGGQTELIDDTVGRIVHYHENSTKDEYNKEIVEYADKIEEVINDINKLSNNCHKKITEKFSLDIMAKSISNEIDKYIDLEKDKKGSFIATPLEYELSLESLYDSYFLFCKTYYANTFNMEYYQEHSNKFKDKIRKWNDFCYRKYATREGKIIANFLRQSYKTLPPLKSAIKYFLLSIPASILLLYKIIRHRR